MSNVQLIVLVFVMGSPVIFSVFVGCISPAIFDSMCSNTFAQGSCFALTVDDSVWLFIED